MKRAIYLSGGGARGAYQVGVLKAIQEIIETKHFPVEILSSVSAGAINAASLAMHADNFPQAIAQLVELWSSLTCDQVFRTSNFALIKSVLRNIFSMLFHLQAKAGGYLLDTKPLKELLDRNLDFEKINQNIDQGFFDAFEIATSCYDTSETVSFFKTKLHPSWKSVGHIAVSTNINCEHILASAALPLFFPTVKIDNFHFGDGGLQLIFPLSSAIKLGADNILIIGTRSTESVEVPTSPKEEISFAKILGIMLNALFLENLDKDLELLEKINNRITTSSSSNHDGKVWKKIKTFYIRPSVDLGKVAEDKIYALPVLLRYLMSVFGSKEQSGDILSFLLFEPAYCKKLIDIGYMDTMNQKNSVLDFFGYNHH